MSPTSSSAAQKGLEPVPFLIQMQPLKQPAVWRFSLYYFFVFGAFVALALWLPRYLVGAYDLDLKTAGLIAAAYSIPASLFRIVGGWASRQIRRAKGDVLDLHRFGHLHLSALLSGNDLCRARRARTD